MNRQSTEDFEDSETIMFISPLCQQLSLVTVFCIYLSIILFLAVTVFCMICELKFDLQPDCS